MKLSLFLLAGVAAAALTPAPLTAQTLTSWDSPVKVTATDGTIAKSAGCEGCPDSGAHSTTLLTGDGYAEFTPAAGRVFAGLSADLSAATASSTIDFAFSLWPSGAWEIRERGVYKKDGTFAPGDRFRVSVEGGRVVYRLNGASLYTSATAPAYPLALDATLYSLGASLSGATVVLTTTVPTVVVPPPPPPTAPPSGPPVVTKTGPYEAVTDRATHAKPALPVLGPAGSVITDPVFGSRIVRVTDASTRPDSLDRSYKTPSSPHQNAWSANGTRFYVVGGGGAVLPYSFDAKTGTARRIPAPASPSGGLILNFYIEPQFSYVRDSIVYGSVVGGSLRTIDQYDFSTGVYTRLVDLDALVPGLAGTYIGGLASSSGPRERVVTMFGGVRQDLHNYVVVFDVLAPATRQLLDTKASTVNGVPTATPLNFLLHHAMIDRSGRYVMLYPTSADQASARKAPQSVLWDTLTNVFTEMPVSARPYGHDAFGYGVSVNKDCCTTTGYDAGQWQFRSLATPLLTSDVITTVLSPKEVYMSDHSTWNNARPDNSAPFISGTYRHSLNTVPFRAWDDEIIAIQTDPAPGVEPTVWRFAHHRSDVTNDLDASATSFWYMPRPNVSNDGHWVLFTSNWEKTLGTDPNGDTGGKARQDVFLVKLKSSVPPVAVGSTALASGRATVGYAEALRASGGKGTYRWSVTGGALPGGLSLDTATGAVTGVPSVAGTSTFTVTVADAVDASNDATAGLAISVANPPVAIGLSAPSTGRLTVPYATSPTVSGGSGAFVWSISSGALPAGLTLDPASGAIAGTPSSTGVFAAVLTAADAAEMGNAASAALTVTVGASPVQLSTATLPDGRERIAYAASLRATGGSGQVTWSIASGQLPDGLTLDTATGAISGKPATPSFGTYNLTIDATDTADATNTGRIAYVLTIASGARITSPRVIPVAAVNEPYSYAVQTTGIQGTVKWDLAGGAMPPGMSLDPVTGVISGTCATPGTWYFNARVRDVSTSYTLTLTLEVR